MAKQDLYRHATIRLVNGPLQAMARLEYSSKDKCFVAQLDGSGMLGGFTDMTFKLNQQLMNRIAFLPDGSIELRL
jgi:hypothetical protein